MLSIRGLPERVRALDRVRVDQLVAIVLLVGIELQVWLGDSIRDRAAGVLAGVVLAFAVSTRRRWPLSGVSAVLALMTVRIASGDPYKLGSIAGVGVAVLPVPLGQRFGLVQRGPPVLEHTLWLVQHRDTLRVARVRVVGEWVEACVSALGS